MIFKYNIAIIDYIKRPFFSNAFNVYKIILTDYSCFCKKKIFKIKIDKILRKIAYVTRRRLTG